MPAQAGLSVYKLDPVTDLIIKVTNSNDPQIKHLADWISWQRIIDPINLTKSTASDLNITYGALVPYLNGKEVDTVGGPAANAVDPALDAVYRCPSDNLGSRPSSADASHGIYRYSYSININYANPIKNYAAPYNSPGQRVDAPFTGKFASIPNTSEKVLYICEDELTLRSGVFQADATGWLAGLYVDNVATRHESKIRNTVKQLSNGTNVGTVNQDGYGNVVFCDGHGEFFSRKDAMRSKYSGDPVPDPPGF
jgi:prepilin-type processing-associated H-X9-DG protein